VSAEAEIAVADVGETRPWLRAFCWLFFLAPFFYLTYGAANALAAQRADVLSIVFSWEHRIPFLGWTIVPYWSINAFYGLSPFICETRSELEVHIRRLLTAQIAAVTCFVLFPLQFTFARPPSDGLAGTLFAALASFDKPFNQAPSLHIALLVILWPLYWKRVPVALRWPLHAWFALVGASVLTTYQHHFVDIPTGALLGVFCLWSWPDRGTSPWRVAALTSERRRLILAARYLSGAAVVAALAGWIGGAGWWLLWVTVSLTLVAANYAVFGPDGFQKTVDGHMSLAARLLLAPYLAAGLINSRWWTRRESEPIAVADGVWLGRIPRARDAAHFNAVIDCCAELPGALTPGVWRCIPMLDLVAPRPAHLRNAADCVERARPAGRVLVCCALGYSRSAATVATWLLMNDSAISADEAIEKVRRARPRIVIDSTMSAAISAAAAAGRRA